jgi:hypothetical protein
MAIIKRRRTVVSGLAPNQAQYTRIPQPSAGVTEMVYEKPVLYPLQSLLAGGVRATSQIRSMPPLVLDAVWSATNTPIWGSGVPAGDVDMTSLSANPAYDGSS